MTPDLESIIEGKNVLHVRNVPFRLTLQRPVPVFLFHIWDTARQEYRGRIHQHRRRPKARSNLLAEPDNFVSIAHVASEC